MPTAKKPKSFALGDRVTWSSQAAGSWVKKTGKVIEVVATGSRPLRIHHLGKRDHESYVVEVSPEAKSSVRPRKPVMYWPLVSALSRAKGRARTA